MSPISSESSASRAVSARASAARASKEINCFIPSRLECLLNWWMKRYLETSRAAKAFHFGSFSLSAASRPRHFFTLSVVARWILEHPVLLTHWARSSRPSRDRHARRYFRARRRPRLRRQDTNALRDDKGRAGATQLARLSRRRLWEDRREKRSTTTTGRQRRGRGASSEIAADKPYSFNANRADEISHMSGTVSLPETERLNLPVFRHASRREMPRLEDRKTENEYWYEQKNRD